MKDGMKQSQKLLLTWLIEDTRLFPIVSKHVSADDFTEELYHKVATEVFAQFKETGVVTPAKIINMFELEEEQAEVAGLFNARIHEVETQSEMEKALKETIIRVKQNSLTFRESHADPTDMMAMMQFIEERKGLQQLEKMHISII